ncbi:hypothetical protein NKG05_21580 [Oerskovia sp. M15]
MTASAFPTGTGATSAGGPAGTPAQSANILVVEDEPPSPPRSPSA